MAPFTVALLSPSTVFLLVALVLLVAVCLLGGSRKPSLKLPPGPRPLPLIGNLHLIDIRRQDLSFMKLSEKYGPVFTLHFGWQKVVVLTGYEAVKEALVNQGNDFIDKPNTPIYVDIQNWGGVIFSKGEVWKTTRRFTLTAMRDLGMGKNRVEGRIQEELHFLIEMIESFKGKPFKLKSLMGAPANITFAMLFGDRFDYEDPLFVTFLGIIDDVVTLLGVTPLQLYNVYPFLGFLLKPQKIILERIAIIHTVLRQKLQESRQNVSENNIRTYIDMMMSKQQEENSKGTKENEKIFYDDSVVASVIDLALAGSETTSTTLQWAVLLMMKYPEIQQKVQEEIKRVLGAERLPTFEDRKQMPYCQAVIHEVQRFISLLPQMPRAAAVDTTFRGYFIPKGTMVIPSLTSVLYDKTQWETPNQFNPNHFLDAEGNFVKKDAFLPFSIGRRTCVGETLARMELFLFFVGLLQKYTFQPPPGMDLDLTTMVTFTLRPQPQSACAVACQ
ncbi:cytochrome P450 2W1-like [Tiliqua scincoides]|uniref:cytochrome P450 2W1-like n=1 Tax=Tiliqua scincoides TaxID=71010 RepID=UPI003461EFAC